ncbi:hypothetical protein ACI797_10110 [Geodermatophilus sp. SYSU D00691]
MGISHLHPDTSVGSDAGPQSVRVLALSGHDSTPWTIDAMERVIGDGYRTLRVGEELRIDAAG